MSSLSNLSKLSQIKLPSGTQYALIDKDLRGIIASDYAVGTAYAVNDYVIYKDDLYRVTSAISASANTGWTAVTKSNVTISNELKDIRASLSTVFHYIGYTTTELSDGATTNPIIINGTSHTAVSGDIVVYQVKDTSGKVTKELEFLFDGSKWNEFGSTGALKALAFKDSASGTVSMTSTGSVTISSTGTAAAQKFTGTAADITISGNVTGTGVTMTPTDENKVSVTSFKSGGSFTQGSDSFTQGTDSFSQGADSFSQGSDTFSQGTDSYTAETYTVSNEVLTITASAFTQGTDSFTQGKDSFTQGKDTYTQGTDSFTQGSDLFTAATGDTAVSVLKSLPTPSVTQGTFSGKTSYTPAGTNEASSVSASGSSSVSVSGSASVTVS